MNEVSLEIARREVHFGLRFEGYRHVPATGAYTFTTHSDDGRILCIKNTCHT